MYKKLLITSFAFFVSLISFFVLSGDASAAKWPGNQWADNSEIQIVLSVNQSHKHSSGKSTRFALYSRTPGNKTITINGYNNGNPKCDNKRNTPVTAKVFELSNRNNFRGFGGDDYNCNSKDLTLTNSDTVVYQKWDNPNETYTYYMYQVAAELLNASPSDPQDNDSKFAFTVDSNDGDFYQLKGDNNIFGLPIASNRGNVYLNNIRIPVGSCKQSGGQRFVIYDSDNAADYWAQSRYPDYAGYKPVKFFLNYQIGFASSKLAKESSSGLDWKKVDGDSIYYPDDTPYAPNARPPGSITWDIDQLNNNNKAYFVIKDLGGDNFLNIYVPYDGAEAGIGCPPERDDTPTDEWRLNPSVSINNGSENGVYMSGAHNVQFFYDNGLSGIPGSLGVGNGEGNVNNGNSYVDVNASLKLNGAEQASTNRFYLLDQHNGSSNKTTSYSVPNSPGKYCANMQFPYGEIGRKKTAEVAQNPDYDLIRRYRTFYSGSSIIEYHASTYRKYMLNDNNSNKLENQWIRWGFEGPSKPADPAYYESGYNNWPSGFPQDRFWTFWGHLNGAGSINGSTPEKCVYVINASPNSLSDIPYEKGSGASISASISIDTGGATPPLTNVGWHLYITGSGLNISKPVTAQTNGTNLSISNVFTAAEQTVINNLEPGTQLDYRVVVDATGEEKAGKITVYEVPFARFYGNDVYATNGDIKFNSYTNNPSHTYDGRGSVAQYAALATGTHTIDTAAFRLNAAIPPIAPNGLDPNGSYLGNTGATKVYNEVVSKIPTNCGTTPSSYLLPSSSGCYRVSDDYRLTGIPRIGGSDGITCLDKQRINPLHTCGFPNNFEYITSNYDKKITLYNPDPNKPFMIVGDIVNTSASYSNPSSTGVMLIVSAGDIIIDNNVKRVDAILISNKGIHTCGWTWAPGYGSKVGQNQIDETCTSNLTINGSLSAKTIDFRRVGGSRYLNSAPGDEQQNCQISKGLRNCGDRGAMPLDTGKTAEIINFPAYLYWATPYLLDQAESGGTNEAMFVAPPRL